MLDHTFTTDELMYAVAATNSDAYCVETEEQANEIIEDWENSHTKTILKDGDEDFNIWAERLDFIDNAPHRIFLGMLDNYQVAFVLSEDNPN